MGCGTCVPVARSRTQSRWSDKLAVVNLALCKGHGKCADACPVGGIVLTSGAAVQRVEVPRGGHRLRVQRARPLRRRRTGRTRPDQERDQRGQARRRAHRRDSRARRAGGSRRVRRGGGGLRTGGAGRRPGGHAPRLRYVVLEQGTLADTIRKYPRHKLLLAEPLSVPLYGDLWVSDASKEQLLQVWEKIIAQDRPRRAHQPARESDRGADGRRSPCLPAAVFRARRVVLAMGRRGTPRRLGVPGEDADKVLYDIVEMEAFAGQHMLVVGGGDSAVESALGLAHQEGTTVTLSYRGAEFSRVKERNREKLDEAVRGGKVRCCSRARCARSARTMWCSSGRGIRSWSRNDVVVVRIGGEPPYNVPGADRCPHRARRSSRCPSPSPRSRADGGPACCSMPARCSAPSSSRRRAPGAVPARAGLARAAGQRARALRRTDPVPPVPRQRGGKDGMDERCLACHKEVAWMRNQRSAVSTRARPGTLRPVPSRPRRARLRAGRLGRGPAEKFDHAPHRLRARGQARGPRVREVPQAAAKKSPASRALIEGDRAKSWLGLETAAPRATPTRTAASSAPTAPAATPDRGWKPGGRLRPREDRVPAHRRAREGRVRQVPRAAVR